MFDSLPDALFTLVVEFADYDGILFASLQKRKTQSAYLKSRTRDFFYHACERGHLNVIQYFNPNLIEIRYNDNLAIRWAAQNGYLHVIQYFVGCGLTLKDIRSCNNNALHLSARNGYLYMIQYFVECGLTLADIRSNNNSALYWAALNGHQHVVDYLCERFNIT